MNRDDTRKNIRNASFRRYTILSDSLNTLSNTAHCRSTCCKWSNTTKLFICIMLVLMAQNEIDDITMCRGMKKVCFYYFGAGDDWMRSIENTSHSIECEFFRLHSAESLSILFIPSHFAYYLWNFRRCFVIESEQTDTTTCRSSFRWINLRVSAAFSTRCFEIHTSNAIELHINNRCLSRIHWKLKYCLHKMDFSWATMFIHCVNKVSSFIVVYWIVLCVS